MLGAGCWVLLLLGAWVLGAAAAWVLGAVLGAAVMVLLGAVLGAPRSRRELLVRVVLVLGAGCLVLVLGAVCLGSGKAFLLRGHRGL